MLLNVLTWNTNFIHDNWFSRIKNINEELKFCIDDYDIIAIQEATLPFSDALYDVYKFLKQKPDINLFTSTEFFHELSFLYTKIKDYFPKYKMHIKIIFEWLMNKLLYFSCWVTSKYGEYLKQLYFKHPYMFIILIVLCPIFFFGLLGLV